MRTILLTVVVLFLDQISKWLVMQRMTLHQSIPVIENVLYLTYVRNFGAAFSLLANHTGFFIFATLAVVLFIIYFWKNLPQENYLMRAALAILLGGAFGNLLDRIRLGYVVDFLDIHVWPVFNVADIAIVLGVGLLLLDLARTPREEGT